MLLSLVSKNCGSAAIHCDINVENETVFYEVALRTRTSRETKTYKDFKTACAKFKEYRSIVEGESEE